MNTVEDLIGALINLPPKAEIGSNHSTAEIYVADETGRPRLRFSFVKGAICEKISNEPTTPSTLSKQKRKTKKGSKTPS